MNLLRSAGLLALLCSLAPLPAPAQLELKSWLGSAFVIPGEETELWLSILSETRPDAPPQPPRTPNVGVRFESDPVYPQRTRDLLYVYKYSVLSFTEGTHTIPPFELAVQGRTLRSQPVTLHVASLPESAWSTHALEGEEIRYAGIVFLPQRVPYEGETFPTEAKVYLPDHVQVSKATIAELDHDGVAAWRFAVSELPYTQDVFQSRVRINGLRYMGTAFRSTANPIRTGSVSLGPGHARIELDTQFLRDGQPRRRTIPTRLPVPQRSFEVRPLPPDPPPGFHNAVGTFTLTATADTQGMQEGDAISLRLNVSGVGNLDTLAAPEMVGDTSQWTIHPPSRLERQGERRDVSGVVTFSQIIRPLGDQRVVPPFHLVSFDPELERYTTATSAPIPFEVTVPPRSASAAPSAILPDVDTPVEAMEGILGIIDPRPPRALPGEPAWWLSWQLVPALLALLLIGRIAQRHLLPRLRRPRPEKEILHALASVEQAGPGARSFLRAAGGFIESWVPDDLRDEHLDAILVRRDHDCYQPGATEQSLTEEERRTMLRHLRKRSLAALSLLVLLAALVSPLQAQSPPDESLYRQAAAAWEEGAYHAAIDLYNQAHPDGEIPADVSYNLGNCYFQLGDPGRAALHYHRALLRDPRHPEALQNLRFLKRKTGAITIVRPVHQEWLARVDRSLFGTLLAAGLWTVALAGLGLFALLGKSLRTLAWIGLALGPLTAVTAGVGLVLYPDDAEFAPVEERAIVVTSGNTVARTEASIDGEEVITVPPGSLCRPLAQRGPWTYLELADRTRGWLPSSELELIVPAPPSTSAATGDLGA